jgi:hypothetical protein
MNQRVLIIYKGLQKGRCWQIYKLTAPGIRYHYSGAEYENQSVPAVDSRCCPGPGRSRHHT